jgi:hypothetical protein
VLINGTSVPIKVNNNNISNSNNNNNNNNNNNRLKDESYQISLGKSEGKKEVSGKASETDGVNKVANERI